jgi:methylmalonyl-CoA/ethylmalonyl-CoA epimerase
VIKGLEHVSIVLKDLEAGIRQYSALYGMEPSERGEMESGGYKFALFRFADGTFVELITPTRDDSPVAKRLAASGDGVYLVAVTVADMQSAVDNLRGNGVRLIGDAGPSRPAPSQVFVHPASAGGVLTYISQNHTDGGQEQGRAGT